MEKKIQKDSQVTVHFIGKFDDGEVFESSVEQNDPLDFKMGEGEIIQGFEDNIIGMAEGDKKKFVVGCEDAYGLYDEELVIEVPKEELGDLDGVEPGMLVYLDGEEEGEKFEFILLEVGKDTVVLDGNHPLAGEDLHFDVEVLKVG